MIKTLVFGTLLVLAVYLCKEAEGKSPFLDDLCEKCDYCKTDPACEGCEQCEQCESRKQVRTPRHLPLQSGGKDSFSSFDLIFNADKMSQHCVMQIVQR